MANVKRMPFDSDFPRHYAVRQIPGLDKHPELTKIARHAAFNYVALDSRGQESTGLVEADFDQ